MTTDRVTHSRSSRRDLPSQQPATLKLIDTQRRTVERIVLAEPCVLCGGAHRYRETGLRVSGCKQGLVNVVAA